MGVNWPRRQQFLLKGLQRDKMETLLTTICEHAHHAHWIIFVLLMLAGLNIPFSEDLLVMGGGVLASTCIPEGTLRLYLWLYFGCWISAWEAYWLGRLLGPKLYAIPWFKHVITPHRIERLHHYYEKFGLLTFMVGRFCPGGVRNGLFMTSGLGKMPFLKFIGRDGFACLFSTTTLFFLGYKFGQNYDLLVTYFKRYEIAFIFFLLMLLVGWIVFRLKYYEE